VETREIAAGFNIDLNAAGRIIGFDIDHASQKIDLTTLESIALPLRIARVA
jgi:uncharacterized protein YuzE